MEAASPRARRAPPSSLAARRPAGSAPAPVPLAPAPTRDSSRDAISGDSCGCSALRDSCTSRLHRGEAAGDGEFLCCGDGCRVVGSRNTLQNHVGHRSVTTREAGKQRALVSLCCHWPLLEHLLSANLSATRPLPALLGIHRREEGGLVLGELGAEDPEWLAPTPGVWRSPTPWILQSDKGCRTTITRVTSLSLTKHHSQLSGAPALFTLRSYLRRSKAL